MKHLCAAWSFFIFSLLVSTYKWGIFKFDHVHAWMIRAWIWSSNVLVESVVCIRRRPSPVSNVVLRHIPCTSLKAPWTSILSSCTQTSWMVHITHQDNKSSRKKNCACLRIFAPGLRIFCARFAGWVFAIQPNACINDVEFIHSHACSNILY